jgi:hypothetical protein
VSWFKLCVQYFHSFSEKKAELRYIDLKQYYVTLVCKGVSEE